MRMEEKTMVCRYAAKIQLNTAWRADRVPINSGDGRLWVHFRITEFL